MVTEGEKVGVHTFYRVLIGMVSYDTNENLDKYVLHIYMSDIFGRYLHHIVVICLYTMITVVEIGRICYLMHIYTCTK